MFVYGQIEQFQLNIKKKRKHLTKKKTIVLINNVISYPYLLFTQNLPSYFNQSQMLKWNANGKQNHTTFVNKKKIIH